MYREYKKENGEIISLVSRLSLNIAYGTLKLESDLLSKISWSSLFFILENLLYLIGFVEIC